MHIYKLCYLVLKIQWWASDYDKVHTVLLSFPKGLQKQDCRVMKTPVSPFG